MGAVSLRRLHCIKFVGKMQRLLLRVVQIGEKNYKFGVIVDLKSLESKINQLNLCFSLKLMF